MRQPVAGVAVELTRRAVHAAAVDRIAELFERPKPYDPVAVPGRVLETEKENDDAVTGKRGIIHDLGEVQNEYADARSDEFTTLVLPVLQAMPLRRIVEESGLNPSTVKRIRAGRQRPHPGSATPRRSPRLPPTLRSTGRKRSHDNFRKAGEPTQGNYHRDFTDALATGWIAEDHANAGNYYITSTGEAAIKNGFPGKIRRPAKKKLRKTNGGDET